MSHRFNCPQPTCQRCAHRDRRRHHNVTRSADLAGLSPHPFCGSCQGGVTTQLMTCASSLDRVMPFSHTWECLSSPYQEVMHETPRRHNCAMNVGICRTVKRVSDQAFRAQVLETLYRCAWLGGTRRWWLRQSLFRSTVVRAKHPSSVPMQRRRCMPKACGPRPQSVMKPASVWSRYSSPIGCDETPHGFSGCQGARQLNR